MWYIFHLKIRWTNLWIYLNIDEIKNKNKAIVSLKNKFCVVSFLWKTRSTNLQCNPDVPAGSCAHLSWKRRSYRLASLPWRCTPPAPDSRCRSEGWSFAWSIWRPARHFYVPVQKTHLQIILQIEQSVCLKIQFTNTIYLL